MICLEHTYSLAEEKGCSEAAEYISSLYSSGLFDDNALMYAYLGILCLESTVATHGAVVPDEADEDIVAQIRSQLDQARSYLELAFQVLSKSDTLLFYILKVTIRPIFEGSGLWISLPIFLHLCSRHCYGSHRKKMTLARLDYWSMSLFKDALITPMGIGINCFGIIVI